MKEVYVHFIMPMKRFNFIYHFFFLFIHKLNNYSEMRNKIYTFQLISRTDQIVPLYIMDIAGYISGLRGIIISGVVCSSLG